MVTEAPTEFTATYGPLIILATIVLPALVAAWLVSLFRKASFETARWINADFTSTGAVPSSGDDGDDD